METTIKVKARDNFSVPNMKSFERGDVRHLPERIALTLMARGLVEEFKEPKPKSEKEESKKSSSKKSESKK